MYPKLDIYLSDNSVSGDEKNERKSWVRVGSTNYCYISTAKLNWNAKTSLVILQLIQI